MSSTIIDEASIASEISDHAIASKIANATESNIDDVRSDIMSSSLPDDQKSKAIQLLEDQLTAIDTKKRYEVDRAVMDIVRDNGYDKFKGMVDEISNFRGYQISDVLNLVNEKKVISSSQPPRIKQYLLIKLQDQLLKNLTQEISLAKYKTENSIKDIIDFIKNLTSLEKNGYLGSTQKQQIMKEVAASIDNSLTNMIASNKRLFANPDGYNPTLLSNLLDQTYGEGGLKEFFELKTAESEKLKEKVDYMTGLSNVANAISASGAGGKKLKISDAEAQMFSKIYFTEPPRLARDNLTSLLVDIGNLSIEDSQLPTSAGFVFGDKVRGLMARVDALPDKDRYAALIVLKRKCFAAYRADSDQFYRLNAGSTAGAMTFLSGSGGVEAFKRGVADLWNYDNNIGGAEEDANLGVLNLIDKRLKELSSKDYYRSAGLEAISIVQKFASKDTVDNALNAESGPSM